MNDGFSGHAGVFALHGGIGSFSFVNKNSQSRMFAIVHDGAMSCELSVNEQIQVIDLVFSLPNNILIDKLHSL
jgi:hypothetical protein